MLQVCSDLNVYAIPPQIHELRTSPPKIMVHVVGAFGRSLCNESGILMKVISALAKENPQNPWPLLPCENIAKRCDL